MTYHSVIINSIKSLLTIILIKLLKCLNLPSKIAVIMDGNRRYAKTANIKKIEGHKRGFDKLISLCEWCINLNIKEIAAFTFSIDNFNRSKDEINDLMDLFKENFLNLEETHFFKKNDIKVEIIGNMNYLEYDLIEKFEKIKSRTLSHKRLKLKLYIAYNSSEEINNTLKTIISRIKFNVEDLKSLIEDKLILKKNNNEIEEKKIYKHLINVFENSMYDKTKYDLLIRTSGENRLSNFLLYQCCNSKLYFLKKNWPEINIIDIAKVLVNYHYFY